MRSRSVYTVPPFCCETGRYLGPEGIYKRVPKHFPFMRFERVAAEGSEKYK